MTPIEEQTRGQRAAELLENELLQQSLDAIKAEIIEQWTSCPARDAQGKEALWQLHKMACKFEGLLKGYVETGKLAAENLKRYEEQGRLARIFRAS